MRAFADALDSVPMTLAENSGLSPIETLANIKSRQAKEKNTRLGVDCMQTGSNGECTILYPLNLLHPLVHIRTFSISLVPDRHHQHNHVSPSQPSFIPAPLWHTTETRGCPVPWCIRLAVSNASTGCSAVPPRDTNVERHCFAVTHITCTA